MEVIFYYQAFHRLLSDSDREPESSHRTRVSLSDTLAAVHQSHKTSKYTDSYTEILKINSNALKGSTKIIGALKKHLLQLTLLNLHPLTCC